MLVADSPRDPVLHAHVPDQLQGHPILERRGEELGPAQAEAVHQAIEGIVEELVPPDGRATIGAHKIGL